MTAVHHVRLEEITPVHRICPLGVVVCVSGAGRAGDDERWSSGLEHVVEDRDCTVREQVGGPARQTVEEVDDRQCPRVGYVGPVHVDVAHGYVVVGGTHVEHAHMTGADCP